MFVSACPPVQRRRAVLRITKQSKSCREVSATPGHADVLLAIQIMMVFSASRRDAPATILKEMMKMPSDPDSDVPVDINIVISSDSQAMPQQPQTIHRKAVIPEDVLPR